MKVLKPCNERSRNPPTGRQRAGGHRPEADLASVRDDEDLREALDLDSMDFQNFVIGLHRQRPSDTRGRLPQAVLPRGVLAYLG